MNRKPKILISRYSKSDGKAYADAVEVAGGEPHVEYVYTGDELFDGLILAGGEDVDPSYYGEECNGSNPPDLPRDIAEFALCKKYIDAGRPIFGVCRGAQLLNVYFGGTLIQHLPTAHLHRKEGDEHATHPSTVEEGSLMHRLLGKKEFLVTTIHHQAIDRVADGFRVTQYSKEDGVIEAIEHETLPIFAVQWHPEKFCADERRDHEPSAQALFDYFVDLCRGKK